MYRFFKSLRERMGAVPAEFAAVAGHLEKLRDLEREAAADPGYEDSAENVVSAAYDRYEAGWLQLHDLIHAGPLPDIWLWFHAWIERNGAAFGDAELCGRGQKCRWLPAARSLRTVLLKSIERRAVERLSRPEDETLWKNPRIRSLLASLASTPPAEGGPQLASILALLTPALRIQESGLDPHVRRQLEERRAQAHWFEYRGLEVVQEAESVFVRLAFTESLPEEDEIVLHLADRDSRRTFWQLTTRLRKQADHKPVPRSGSRLVPWKLHDSPIDIRVDRDRVEWRVPAQAWAELGVAPGTVLSMDIRFGGGGFLAGCVPAPEVTVTSPLPRCSRCGELTPVVVDGEFCPACRVERLSPNRPIASADASRLEQVRRQWANTPCPKCGAHRFARRFPELFSGGFRCEPVPERMDVEGRQTYRARPARAPVAGAGAGRQCNPI